jgi:hypothetical protein
MGYGLYLSGANRQGLERLINFMQCMNKAPELTGAFFVLKHIISHMAQKARQQHITFRLNPSLASDGMSYVFRNLAKTSEFINK